MSTIRTWYRIREPGGGLNSGLLPGFTPLEKRETIQDITSHLFFQLPQSLPESEPASWSFRFHG